MWSQSGQYTGRTNIPLTPVGREQAAAAGERLRATFPNGFTPSNIYTSDLARAMETAELAGFAEHNVTADLEEWGLRPRRKAAREEQLNAAAGYEWNVWRGRSALT